MVFNIDSNWVESKLIMMFLKYVMIGVFIE